MKIVMITNDTNFAYNLRREILEQFVKEGHEAVLVAEILNFKEQFGKMGIRLVDVKTGRHGTNPMDDLNLFRLYYRILKTERPQIVFTNNIKPNVYAGLACKMLKIPYIPNITGLGTPVENPGPLQKLTTYLYKLGVSGSKTIFFQNSENQEFFEDRNMIPKGCKPVLLPGSGVDLNSHPVLPYPGENAQIHFLFVARIMKEKGIDLFLAAAKKFTKERSDVVFDVVGQCDDPAYQDILKTAQENGEIIYHGLQSNVSPFYEKCSCFLYPSYYPEGMSNVLLEAAASGRPVIAADRAGCRETLDDGVTGFLVPVNDEKAVIEATEKILQMSSEERKAMGLRGSEKTRREFDRKIVVEAYWEEIQRITGV